MKKFILSCMMAVLVGCSPSYPRDTGVARLNRLSMDEVNEKIEACEDELLELPKQIKETNERLMLASMEFCYEKLRTNDEEIKEIDAWIKQVRIDLKKNIIKKQNREINSKEIYSYMHDIFGAEIIDVFDLKEAEEQEQKKEEE